MASEVLENLHKTLPNLKQLSLADCGIENLDDDDIVEAFSCHKHLQYLDLSENLIDSFS